MTSGNILPIFYVRQRITAAFYNKSSSVVLIVVFVPGNISGIVTPIAIGYIVGTTGSFNGALIYVGVHALVAIISYLVLIGDIKRIELKPVAGQLS